MASFENNNDNAAAGLDPEALANVVGYRELTLPCGRYYLDSVNAATELVINVPNRVALFVGGDFFVSGNVKVSLAGTGEIDIFVVGDFLVNGAGHFGDPARPAGSRIYVAGNKGIALNGSSTFIGNLFAPNAIVSANSNLEVFGSIYSAGFVANGWAKIHYDKGILKAGEKMQATTAQAMWDVRRL